MMVIGDDDDDGWDGGDGNTRRRNLNWEIPAASLVIPRSEKSGCGGTDMVEYLFQFYQLFGKRGKWLRRSVLVINWCSDKLV